MDELNAKKITDDFHKLYYTTGKKGGTWQNTTWLGVNAQKNPMDLWIYQEILYEIKPDVVLETGTADGGSAYYMASIMDLMDKGRVVSVDIESKERPQHDRVTYITGSSSDQEIFSQAKSHIKEGDVVMVILDSDHSRDHVFDELNLYADLVTSGSYLIVEDTNVNGNPVVPEFGPGPMEAMDEYLKNNDNFERDDSKEKFFFTFNPRGFLKRK